jgi:hypothetical protein
MNPREATGKQGNGERCPTCGTTDRGDRFVQIDQGRAYDAGISGCPDPFHDVDPASPQSDREERGS